MKNKIQSGTQRGKLLSLFCAIAAVVVFSTAACSSPGDGSSGGNSGSGGGGGTGTDETSVMYASRNAATGDTYLLTILKANSGRAVYTPKAGDTYEMIITSTDGTAKTSNGTVQSYTNGMLTLKPFNSDNTFTVKISGGNMTEIIGTITMTDSTTQTAPGTVTPASPRANEFINAGIIALNKGYYDDAVSFFESAYALEKTPETILYSSLGKLSSIAVSTKVKALMKDRLGIKNYPGRIDSLLTPDWMEVYTDQELVRWIYDGGYASWYDKKDNFFFSYYGLTPKSGYYKSRILNPSVMHLGETSKRPGGDYYYSDENGHYYTWYDNNYNDYTGFTVPGYYWIQGSTYDLFSETPQYNYYTSRFPGMDVPSWFGNTNTYKDSLTTTSLKTWSTFSMLTYVNLIDKNTSGLNTLLDELLSGVFGADFEAVYERAGTMTGYVTLKKSTLDAFGISDIYEGGEVSVGKAELNVLFAALRFVKASLEWVAAYDWNTDVNFLRNGPLWDDWSKLGSNKPANLPLRNNFLKDRNNGNMAKSKADFNRAIDDSTAAYNLWIGGSSNLPQGYKDTLNDYKWVKDGLDKLKTAINGNGRFYVKESSGASYDNSAANALFGIDFGKFFTPGYLSIDKWLESENVAGKGTAPVFYGYMSGVWTKLSDKAQFSSYEWIGLRIKTAALKEVVVTGANDMKDEIELQFLPPDFAAGVWDWYHN
jgi:hypothetical protein